MKPIKTILRPGCGEVVYNCHLEAIIYCATNKVDVEYIHNATTYGIKFENLYSVVDSSEKI